MQSDIVQRLEALYVWPQSVADHHADILTPRQIENLYAVGQVGTEAAAEITRLTEALRAAEERVKELREVAIKLHGALAAHTCEGCPRCPGDCAGANPPMMDCPTQRAIEAYRAFDAALKGPSHD